MSTNEERREAAKRKLEERLEAERQQKHRRRVVIMSISGVVVLAVLATAGFFSWRAWDNSRHTECTYADAPVDWDEIVASTRAQLEQAPAEQKAEGEAFLTMLEEGAAKARTAGKPEDRARNSGTVNLTFKTNRGEVPMTLNREQAACNVNAVVSLARGGFYDGTACHRLAIQDGLNILQCGDPTGTGAGSPGWSSPDEEPTFLETETLDPQLEALGMTPKATYPRGTVAIANRNDEQSGITDTGSAQFFIVSKDSQLPPTLSVIGKVSEDGMKVVDGVVEGGIGEGPGSSEQSGPPKTTLILESASVSD